MAGMRYQPQGLLRIDQGSPLAALLRIAILPGVNRSMDAASQRAIVATGTKQVYVPSGLAASFSGTADKIVTTFSGAFQSARTYFFSGRRNGAGGGGLGRLFDKTSGTTGQFLCWYGTYADLMYGFYTTSSPNGGGTLFERNVLLNSGNLAGIGRDFAVRLEHIYDTAGSSVINAWINDTPVLTNYVVPGYLLDAPTTAITIGNRNSDNARGWDGLIDSANVWDRTLGGSDSLALKANRYQLFVDPSEADDVVPVAVGSYKLTADPGVFALSASSVMLRASRGMQASAGVFSTSGASARLVAGRRMQVLSGAFGLSGAGAAVLASRRLPVALGAFSLAGGLVGLTIGRRLPAGSGAFGLGGAAVALLATRRLAKEPGVFGLVGANAGLRAARRLAASTGMFALGPNSVQMVYQPVTDPGGGLPKYTLTAAPGSFGIVGSSALLRASRQLQATPGVILLSGRDAGLAVARRLQAGAGGLFIAGAPVGVLAARRIAAQVGTFDLQGLPVQLRYSAQIEYARAPGGSGYAPQRHEYQSRPAATSSTRPAATQRNYR